MAPLTPDQLRRRRRIEAGIRIAAPALDLVLAVGDRVSRMVDRRGDEYYPPRTRSGTADPPPVRDTRPSGA